MCNQKQKTWIKKGTKFNVEGLRIIHIKSIAKQLFRIKCKSIILSMIDIKSVKARKSYSGVVTSLQNT